MSQIPVLTLYYHLIAASISYNITNMCSLFTISISANMVVYYFIVLYFKCVAWRDFIEGWHREVDFRRQKYSIEKIQ